MEKIILVVEDDDTLRKMLTEVLSFNYLVKSASNGEEALDILQLGNICLIISDFQMPVMNGLTFFNTILSDENLRNIPLIGVSGAGNKVDEFKKRSCVFLEKPFHIKDFLKKVEEAF